ncbi:MAG: biotin carboxylase N-terminal domain-containing protein [Candidatus Nanopelagicales bacterium]
MSESVGIEGVEVLEVEELPKINFKRVLVANRGEIALRISRTADKLGIDTVAVFSDPDSECDWRLAFDYGVPLGGTTSAESYLVIDKILDAAEKSGADAIHPGYGFLSENPTFARAVREAGLVWIGPDPESIEAMALKVEAKNLAKEAGVPLVPGAELEGEILDAELTSIGDSVGYPLLVKASAGGGGKGMRIVNSADELVDAVVGAKREAASSFGDDTVFLERYLTHARHVEVQVFGDSHGNVVEFGERECSIQRRHQKVIEEAPSPGISEDLRERMTAAAVALASKINYLGAGTVEFMVPADEQGNETGEFFFLEMNTRLQVEHPVTEQTHDGIDLVEWQFRVADGQELPLTQDEIHAFRGGHSIEVRLYAEDPANDYLPSTGLITRWSSTPSEQIRAEVGFIQGDTITPHYDPMVAKIVSTGITREDATSALVWDLKDRGISGITTNREQLIAILESLEFVSGQTFTDTLEHHPELGDSSVPESRLELATEAAKIAQSFVAAGEQPWGNLAPIGYRNVRGERHDSAARIEQIHYEVSHPQEDTVTTEEADVYFRWQQDGVDIRTRVTLIPPVVGEEYEQTAVVRMGTEPTTTVTLPPRFVNPAGQVAEGSSVAPLPGTVITIDVAEGDQVDEGQTLAVIEAMKMEHRITAGQAGTVAQVLVTTGDSVAAGQALVVIDDAASQNSEEA